MLVDKKIRLVHITTVPDTFHFFRGQIGYIKARDFDVVGLPYLVKDGETGAAGESRAAGRGILDTLDAPEKAKRMAERGRELKRDIFDVRKSAKEKHEIYSILTERM